MPDPSRTSRPPTKAEIAFVSGLTNSLTERGVEQFLTAANRALDGERPIDVMRRGELDRVRAAVQAFEDGAYL